MKKVMIRDIVVEKKDGYEEGYDKGKYEGYEEGYSKGKSKRQYGGVRNSDIYPEGMAPIYDFTPKKDL